MIKWTSTSHICRLGAETCLFLFIHRVNVNYLPVSSFGQENHYCMWQVQSVVILHFFFFFWSRCQQPPASIRVISICLSRCGLKASSALDFDWIHKKKMVSSSNLWRCWYLPCAHEGSSTKPAFFERTRSHDAFTPALMKHSCYLSSSQLWCDLILLVFLIKDQEQPPSPIYLHLPSFKVNWVRVSYQCFHDRKLEITERSAQMEGRRIARTPDFHLITAPSPCRERLPPNPDCIYAFSRLTQLQPEWISWTIGLEIVCEKVIMNT